MFCVSPGNLPNMLLAGLHSKAAKSYLKVHHNSTPEKVKL